MQKGEFRPLVRAAENSVWPPEWMKMDERPRSMTEAQGERIIGLLEQLARQTEKPAPLPPGPALDKVIAEDFKRRNVTYPDGY